MLTYLTRSALFGATAYYGTQILQVSCEQLRNSRWTDLASESTFTTIRFLDPQKIALISTLFAVINSFAEVFLYHLSYATFGTTKSLSVNKAEGLMVRTIAVLTIVSYLSVKLKLASSPVVACASIAATLFTYSTIKRNICNYAV